MKTPSRAISIVKQVIFDSRPLHPRNMFDSHTAATLLSFPSPAKRVSSSLLSRLIQFAYCNNFVPRDGTNPSRRDRSSFGQSWPTFSYGSPHILEAPHLPQLFCNAEESEPMYSTRTRNLYWYIKITLFRPRPWCTSGKNRAVF